MTRRETVEPAALAWRDRQPYSTEFSDIYHDGAGAVEVDRVFIAPSRLVEKARQQRSLLVGELGFGTGLNFVVAAAACLQARARLHFVSFDAAPIAPDQFATLSESRAALHPLYRELSRQYPPLVRGWHRRVLGDGRITLSLYWGDAEAGLEDIQGRQLRGFDVWFLDGFAPDRNPAMWTPALLNRVGALAGDASTVATFTAAGRVRRALEAAGYDMRRVDQRPHKRESLAGERRAHGKPAAPPPAHVRVVGAGLAGASVARHLAEQGVDVTVHEERSAPSGGASGIPATVLHPRLLGDGGVPAALRCHAYLFSHPYLDRWSSDAAPGVLQLAGERQAAERLERIADRYAVTGSWLDYLTPPQAAAVADWPVASPGLYFPHGRVVDTPRLTRALLDHPKVELVTGASVTTLGTADEVTVLACGADCSRFEEARYLELSPVHGQIDILESEQRPSVPVVGNGYLVPGEGRLIVGTTYEYRPWSVETATDANLSQLPEDVRQATRWLGRARGTRGVTSDRLPVAGHLYDLDANPVERLFVTTGHGSMGTVFAPFAGAVVAALISGDFPPLERDLEQALSSARFRTRQARRGYRHGAQP
ncbi:MAG: FAD-dependent 5-carboxymethylaminomethyl-2-thiouridine(34) oxidoreductase MnmC [Pseudomonadales bacterium]|nr:FAD-dependent 5-carboxymethylaminomethyl-2-thiouridine(34) oxidoreductase MnmC [Pseudomonadales bacterium]NIX06538.1 FAD-dependent 5-carboxymethylaminomethyl-2-thiouridine(34) oxidoreductase MnmC [Pseudomonadales bacterium]